MAINLSKSNNVGFSGSGDETIFLSSPINYITITASFQGLLFSVDKGQTFISVPSGTHSFRTGLVTEIRIQSTATWQFIGEQA